MLEETYGSLTMFLMMVVTGFVTGVLNACFFPHPLLGASGIVFMMILLASFTNSGKDEIPLTFILIMILYLGRETLNALRGDDISQFAHLAGGLCGSLFGFFKPSKSGRARKQAAEADTVPAQGSRTVKAQTKRTQMQSSADLPSKAATAKKNASSSRQPKQQSAKVLSKPGKRATMKLPERADD
jgi:hypothetical protein